MSDDTYEAQKAEIERLTAELATACADQRRDDVLYLLRLARRTDSLTDPAQHAYAEVIRRSAHKLRRDEDLDDMITPEQFAAAYAAVLDMWEDPDGYAD